MILKDLKKKDQLLWEVGEGGASKESGNSTLKAPSISNAVTAPKESSAYLDQALEMLKNQPTVTYTPGNYKSKYSEQINAILNDILASEYKGYDANSDPTYSQYKKSYLREADRTEKDVLGQYAAMNGGMASTAAISAASQAGNSFKGQLADKIPELEALAYERYRNDLSSKRQNLSDLTALEKLAYDRFTDEEARKLSEYQQKQSEYDTAFNRLLQAASVSGEKENSEATKALSQISYGVMPSQAGLQALGITKEIAQSMMAGSVGNKLTDETAKLILEYSTKYGVAPSQDVLDYLGQSAAWGDAIVNNAVASANEEEMTAYGTIDFIEQRVQEYSTDEAKEWYVTEMVKKGFLTRDEAVTLLGKYTDELSDEWK